MYNNDWIKKLKEEGFNNFVIWYDKPHAYYPTHAHLETNVHVVLAGEMELNLLSNTHFLKPGDRIDIPGGVKHEAKMGKAGCRYLIGFK